MLPSKRVAILLQRSVESSIYLPHEKTATINNLSSGGYPSNINPGHTCYLLFKLTSRVYVE